MGMIQTKLINNHWAFIDSDAPGTPLGYLSSLGQGGGVLFHVSEFLVINGQVLSAITDPGSGVIISTAERASLHGHTNLPTLAQITSPTAGQVTYSLLATAAGVVSWQPTATLNPFDKGWHADLAALKVAHPTGVDGDFARVINSPGPHALAVWDINAGPADWVEEAGGAVTSIDTSGGAGPIIGDVVFDSDDIGEGTVQLFLTVAERASVALIGGHTTSIASNLSLATHANRTVLDGISGFGSGVIISTAERATVTDLKSPATPANDGKIWGAVSGVGQWIVNTGGGAGTVTSVNGVGPVSGNVTITMTNMTEGATNKILSQTERTTISTTAATTAGNSTAIARITTQQTLTFSTALVFDTASGLNGIVTLTGNTKPALLTGVTAGETARLTLVQDATGGRHVDWGNFAGDPKISKGNGSKTTLEIYIESPTIQRVGVVSRSGNYMARLISFPSTTFDGIGGGATNIYDRVIATTWSWDDVRKYEYALFADLQWSMPQYSQELKDKLVAVKANAPNVKILAMTRYDLWWHWWESGVEFPQYEWGATGFSAKPTVPMGETPVAAADGWAAAQIQIEGAGYTQTASHAAMTNNGALLTLPYEIILNPTSGEWNCRNNVMKVNDDSWLELYSDHIVALRAVNPDVDGFHVNVEKLQHYQTAIFKVATYQLWGWLQNAAGYNNPSWVLATNSGGSVLDAWGSTTGGAGTVLEQYSDRNEGSTMLDVYEGTEKLCLMLRRKDPTAFIHFSPFNFTVNGHLNTVYLGAFRTAYIAREGGTNADSDAYQAALISRMASVCDAIEFPADDAGAFSVDWANQIRASGKSVKWTTKPQNIAVLADQ